MTYQFTKLEKEEIIEEYKNGASIRELAQKFNCSGSPIVRVLIKNFGNNKYIGIGKNHSQETSRKNITKRNKSEKGRKTSQKTGITVGLLPATEKTKEAVRKTGQKTGPENGRKTLTKLWENPTDAMIKSCQKNGRKMGQNNAGDQHPNWKGGISALEFEKKYGMLGEEWKILAQKIRKRDNFVCQYCGKKNSTSVHHIIPARINKDNHFDNLITLCKSCHVKVERLTDKYLKKNRDPMEIFYEKWSN